MLKYRKTLIVFAICVFAAAGILTAYAVLNKNSGKSAVYYEETLPQKEVNEKIRNQISDDAVKKVVAEIESIEIVMPEPIAEPTAPISDAVPLSWTVQQAIVDNCAEYDLDIHLVLGIIEAESDFNEMSDNGICYGLMQIHKGNKGWVRKNAGVTDIYDPVQNIRAGCWILAEGIRLHGDIEKALVWYNAGEVYASSTAYSRTVLKYAAVWSDTVNGTAV